jgi:hypothetical protein
MKLAVCVLKSDNDKTVSIYCSLVPYISAREWVGDMRAQDVEGGAPSCCGQQLRCIYLDGACTWGTPRRGEENSKAYPSLARDTDPSRQPRATYM